MEQTTDRGTHLDSISVQLRDIGDSLGRLARLTQPSAARDDVRGAYRELCDRLTTWREQLERVRAAHADCPNPWFCTVRLPHGGQDVPSDGDCWGDDHRTALNLMHEGNVTVPVVEVAARGPVGGEPEVSLYFEGNDKQCTVALTPWEARRVAAHLLRVAELAEGDRR